MGQTVRVDPATFVRSQQGLPRVSVRGVPAGFHEDARMEGPGVVLVPGGRRVVDLQAPVGMEVEADGRRPAVAEVVQRDEHTDVLPVSVMLGPDLGARQRLL